ncbi:hypothetical protein [Streptomyces sp. NBC_01768]|uniref:hypothetical protein n=1 Tax=Streptomyces sp. NBC_01768 TaxID=2975938 RepID=UPI002DD849E3|nr:hypothetical protein [Streptomyces sp. NBC_01768]WSC32170.1 hypothetical protein OG902_38870 [Streptomyces sp. NBC_01768]
MSDINELGWRILREIEKDHKWREDNPKRFFAVLCDDLWRTTPDDEALDVFKIRATNAGWWASDVVDCVERVVAERPDWAAHTLQCSADLWLGRSAEEAPELYLDWLAERAVELRSVLDEVRRGPE